MKRNLVIAISIVALAFLGTASAQVDTSPGVARISLIHGDVSSQRGDTGDWAAAALNQPLVAGDSVSTGDRSRAELQLDHANILRLGNNSQAHVATLTRTQVQVQVGRGLAYYSAFKDSEAEIEIDTPNVAIRPTSREGVYRVEVNAGETQVIVRKGSADISTPQGSARLEKGQSAVVRGTADEAEYKLVSAPSKDDWDSWNNERDGVIRNAQSWSHTNHYYVGSEDLDAYGHWVTVPDYGPVWQPVVPVGWAPYRAGRWLWEPYWGWTWVSYEPWGWAPYHYGRWFWWNSSWMWWPGPVYPYYRPIWAPAYVSFFGFNGNWGFGFGFGFGSVGWLPIGPCDRFYPWWGRWGHHFNAVNITNITNINNITVVKNYGGVPPLHGGHKFSNLRLASTDPRVREAISTVPTQHFGTGRTAAKPVSAEGFRDGRMMTGNLPLVPTRDHLSATNLPASVTTFSPGAKQERFFTRKQPAAPESFEHQAAQVQRAVQRDPTFRPEGAKADRGSVQAGSASTVRNEQAMRSVGSGQPSGRDGWRRFDRSDAAPSQPARTEPGVNPARSYPSSSATTGSEAPRQDRQGTSERYGWHKFSDSGAKSERRTAGPSGQGRETRPAPPAATPPARSEPSPDRGAGWRHFEPQSQPAESPGRGNSERQAERWTPATSAAENRGGSSYSREYRGPAYRSEPAPAERAPAYRESGRSSRPPLTLQQPIVTPRSSGPSSSGGGRGGYSAPSHGGSGGGAQKGSSGGSRGGGQPHGSHFR